MKGATLRDLESRVFFWQEKSPPEDVRPVIPTAHGSLAVTIPAISGWGVLDGLTGGPKALTWNVLRILKFQTKSLPLGLLGQI